MAYFKVYPSIYLERLRKTMKTLSQYVFEKWVVMM